MTPDCMKNCNLISRNPARENGNDELNEIIIYIYQLMNLIMEGGFLLEIVFKLGDLI